MPILSTALVCLALNIYHEARGEPIKGQYAVALVTVNRAKFNNRDICKVVYRPNQFSWTIYKPSVTDPKSYKLAKQVAKDVLEGKVSDFTNASTYYHADYVKPVWSKKFRRTIKIGRHQFYSVFPRARVATKGLHYYGLPT